MKSELQKLKQKEHDKRRRADPVEKIKHRNFQNNRYKNPEIRKKIREQQKEKYATDLEYRLKSIERQRLYRKTQKCKELHKKVRARRKRDFGFNPFNNYFINSHAHHIDIQNVIYIPSDIHKSVFHIQSNNNSMKQINILAWDYMESRSY